MKTEEYLKLESCIFAFFPESYELYLEAGLLACPVLAAFPSPWGTVARVLLKRLCGLTATGIAPELNRIPF